MVYLLVSAPGVTRPLIKKYLYWYMGAVLGMFKKFTLITSR